MILPRASDSGSERLRHQRRPQRENLASRRLRAQFGADFALQSQYFRSPITGAAEITAIATFQVIEPEVAAANKLHSDLWLTGAVRVIFMSYYVPLPGLDDKGNLDLIGFVEADQMASAYPAKLLQFFAKVEHQSSLTNGWCGLESVPPYA